MARMMRRSAASERLVGDLLQVSATATVLNRRGDTFEDCSWRRRDGRGKVSFSRPMEGNEASLGVDRNRGQISGGIMAQSYTRIEGN